MNVIGHKYIFLGISGFFVLAALTALVLWGVKPGIDFTGGSIMEVEFADTRPDQNEIRNRLTGVDLGDLLIQPTGDRGDILRFRTVDEPTHQEILQKLGTVTEKRFDTIGPTVGAQLRKDSLLALTLTLILITLFIAWSFRKVSEPVASWKYGIIALIALVHDVVIPTGVFAAIGKFRGVEIDAFFITALLTVVGFSMSDTIVVFDRIRENLQRSRSRESFEETVNRSINETAVRSLSISFIALLVLAAIFFFGGETVRYFSLALIIGLFFGAYSSIFVASPLLVVWQPPKTPKGSR
jgi:preprotein translocase subunit SecF